MVEGLFAPTVAAVGLAAVHLFAGRLRVLDVIPRSVWLSGAGGASVAYVFVHVLPELAAGSEAVREAWAVVGFLEHHVYLVALVGFAAFYGLEQFVQQYRGRGDRDDAGTGRTGTDRRGSSRVEDGGSADGTAVDADPTANDGVFWVHVGSFTVYNALIGYLLLHREEAGALSLAFYATAMGLHFVVNDHGLREHHRSAYRHTGRWVLTVAVLVGFGAGAVTTVSEATVATLFAFLAGGVVLNVIKEELPAERRSRFWPFAAGAAAYAALLVAA